MKPTNPLNDPFARPTEHREQGGQNRGDQGHESTGVVTKAGEMASSAATAVGEKAGQGVAAVGCGMESLAGTIREHAPDTGMMHTASSRVAETLESGGRYLKEEGLQGMADDVTDLIRKNPIPAVLIGFGIGFLLARSTRSY